MRAAAIVAAAGTGERFGRSGGKQLAPLLESTVLEHAVRPLAECDRVDSIVVVTHPGRVEEVARLLAGVPKVLEVLPGGDSRQDSVSIGLAAVPAEADAVIVHDGARPLLTVRVVEAVLDALEGDVDAAIVGHPAFDTVKRVGPDGIVSSTEDREGLWLVQTPQAFRIEALRSAVEHAKRSGVSGTDDASLVERIGGRVRVVRGPRDNIKITVPEDLAIAEAVIRARASMREGGAR